MEGRKEKNEEGRQRGGKGAGRKKEMNEKRRNKEFPGGPVVRALCFHQRGHRFDP